ncbi:R-spondin-4 isoform X1 [Paramormyrops kingsleyae]|uniref:R-spondin 4 n=1 Tax=Paramormyrops kingsleyae TaxID=1676925 RepID=A0A3B3RUG3_9TELE|nr:R-spondin-4 isoform X1 [Paramormyrops kingsleyae]
MHLRLLVILTLISNAMMMLTPTARKDSGIKDASEVCRNCQECSHDNGCLRCPEKLFLFLRREGVWHHGSCLHSCPAGHYGVRGRGVNRCMKCKAPSCDSCFSRDFCTKCKPGFQLFKGKCLHNCPEDTYPDLTDCLEDCQLQPWSEWTACRRKGLSCGYRWGRQSRSRQKSPLCPAQSENRKCPMQKRCPGERREAEKKCERKTRGKRRNLCKDEMVTDAPEAPKRHAQGKEDGQVQQQIRL